MSGEESTGEQSRWDKVRWRLPRSLNAGFPETSGKRIPRHLGVSALHSPLVWQMVVLTPINWKPSSQVKLTLSWSPVRLPEMVPFFGGVRTAQRTTGWEPQQHQAQNNNLRRTQKTLRYCRWGFCEGTGSISGHVEVLWPGYENKCD